MTPYADLPDAELNEAVAKKLGWHVVTDSDELGNEWDIWSATDDSVGYICDYGDEPDFPISMDACEPVKQWLWKHGVTEIVTREFSDCIVLVLFGPRTPVHASVVVEEYPHALPRALCIAFMEVPVDGSDRQEE